MEKCKKESELLYYILHGMSQTFSTRTKYGAQFYTKDPQFAGIKEVGGRRSKRNTHA